MADEHSHPPATQENDSKNEIRVDASALIERLRTQRMNLQNELDILTLAYEDMKEQNTNMIQRIAELEDAAQVETSPAKAAKTK